MNSLTIKLRIKKTNKMSKCRIEDYDDEMLNEDEDYHFKKTTKRHHEQYKEYNGRKSKAKNKFKKMRGNKDKYED